MKKIKFILFFVLSLCYNSTVMAQVDYLNDAYRFYQEKHYGDAVIKLQKLMEKYPDLSINFAVKLKIAELQCLNGEKDKAIVALNATLELPEVDVHKLKQYPIDYPIITEFGVQPPVMHWHSSVNDSKFLSCLALSFIYLNKKEYEKAIEYLKRGELAFFPNTGCGNGNNMVLCKLGKLRNNIYKKKGDNVAARNALLDILLCQDCPTKSLIEQLKPLLNQQFTKQEIQAEVESFLTKTELVEEKKGSRTIYKLLFFNHLTNMYMYVGDTDDKAQYLKSILRGEADNFRKLYE